MIKAVIFDMDGLLINSEPVWYRARKDLLKKFNLDWTWDDQKKTMGSSTSTWLEYMYTKVNGLLSKKELLESIIERMKAFYLNKEIEIMPGANEALNYSKTNYKVGLASGSYKDLLYSALKINNWEHIFEEILSGDDISRGKPFPDIYLEVIKQLGVSPIETVILEDSQDGIKAGVAAGANVIAVPSKEVIVNQEVLNSAAVIVDSLFELPNALTKLCN